MSILGEYTEEELAVLRAEPPSGEGNDGGDDDDDNNETPEELTDDEIDDIIENAKENGFDGIDEDDTIDEDEEDLIPEPDEDEEEDEEGGDEKEGEPTEGKDGEPTDDEDGEPTDDEDGEPKEGEDGEPTDDEDDKEQGPTFEDITTESEEDEQRRLRVRYAQLMKRMQNSQKSLSDLANKHGKKIPERILNSMEGSAKQIQDLKEINVYED